MELEPLWDVADRARTTARLTPKDVTFVRTAAPRLFASFPEVKWPARVRHPAGFSISGAAVGTFVRSALLVSGQKALGRRFGGDEFYERVERDLAFRIMRSHFHHGHPKGAFCCVPCTLALLPVLDAGAIRYFDCGGLSRSVTRLIQERGWRFGKPLDAPMVRWALGRRTGQV